MSIIFRFSVYLLKRGEREKTHADVLMVKGSDAEYVVAHTLSFL